MEAVDVLSKMEKCLDDHSKCDSLAPESRKQRCLWPLNHADKKGLNEKNEIRGIPVVSPCGIQAAGLQSETRSRSVTVRMKPDAESTSNKQILCLLGEIHSGLKSDVYDQASIDVIQDTKVILDLPALAAKLHKPDGGSIKITETDFPKFREAVLAIPVRSLSSVPEKALKGQSIQRIFEKAGEINIKLHRGAAQKPGS